MNSSQNPDLKRKNHALLVGTGTALGQQIVQSFSLDQMLKLQTGTIERLTGVVSRPTAGTESQIEMATRAAQNALADAALPATSLDAILHAAAVPYQSIPATAPLIQRALGVLDGAVPAYDVNATCLSALAALQTATAMIETGRWQNALIVSSEIASRGLDWTVPATAGLFGDGAGAMVVSAGKGPGIGPIHLATFPDAYDASALVAGGTRLDHNSTPNAFEAHRLFEMDAAALWKVTRRELQSVVDNVLQSAEWQLSDVDWIVPHQASPRALTRMAKILGVADRIIDISITYGNQIAASLPIALDVGRRDGRIKPGDRVLMLGTAAGVTFGAATLTLPK